MAADDDLLPLTPFVLSAIELVEMAYRMTEVERRSFDTGLRLRSAPTQDERGLGYPEPTTYRHF